MRLWPPPPSDIQAALVLFAYVGLVVLLSKKLYEAIRGMGVEHVRSVYFVRKYIHVFGGGVVALLTPFVFHTPIIPLVVGLLLAAGLAAARATGRLLYWFQVPENAYEVNFCAAWGIGIAALWLATGDPRIAVAPALLISFGDAVTGVVRNLVVKRRSKHWAGNVAMAALTTPLLGAMLGGVGALTALVASAAERLEFGPIDDNVIIVAVSTLMLIVAHATGLI